MKKISFGSIICEVLGIILGAVGLPLVQAMLPILLSGRALTVSPLERALLPKVYEAGYLTTPDIAIVIIGAALPFVWGALLGGATARAFWAIRHKEPDLAAKICIGRGGWIFAIYCALLLFVAYQILNAPYRLAMYRPFWECVAHLLPMQWALLLLLVGRFIRQRQGKTVQVSEEMRW